MAVDLTEIIILLLAGGLAGFIAGLFGVGGGIIIIPVSLWFMGMKDVETDYIQHIAVGTSLSVMVFTTAVSSFGHYKRKSIDWYVFKPLVLGIVSGVLFGSSIAHFIDGKHLQIVFIVFSFIVSIRTLVGFKPKSGETKINKYGVSGGGAIIGFLSGILGIGGGVFNVPFMLYMKVPVKKAVGTSALLSWTTALTGSLTYIFTGSQLNDLPKETVGFLYWPLALTLVIGTVIMTPIGVRLAHKIPENILRISFGILMLAISTQILFKWIL
jgi:uncharacterized membrane protein YfcA